jgi:hypothetical protein
MGLQFLSSEWFEEAERLRAEISPPVPDSIANLVINLVVTAGPSGDISARMEAGRFVTGRSEDAPTTLTVPYDVARQMFIEGDQAAAMQAFMSGQIKVEGDMAAVMGMQAAGPPSAEAQQLSEKIKEMTE